jgi:hypothetical protein
MDPFLLCTEMKFAAGGNGGNDDSPEVTSVYDGGNGSPGGDT